MIDMSYFEEFELYVVLKFEHNSLNFLIDIYESIWPDDYFFRLLIFNKLVLDIKGDK